MRFSRPPKLFFLHTKEAGTKVLASQLFLDCRARRSGWVGSTTLISSAFTALLNCAEVGRRNRILTNYRFLSHSLSFSLLICLPQFSIEEIVDFTELFQVLTTERTKEQSEVFFPSLDKDDHFFNALRPFLYESTEREPIIIPMILTPDDEN